MNWVGTPSYPPSIATATNDSGLVVYTSWNGSTETKFWQIYAGTSINNLQLITSVAKTGFETVIPLVGNNSSYVQVKAVNANGAVIGASTIIGPSK